MDLSFWHRRWEKGEIAFHQNDVNRYLTAHVGLFNLQRDDRVFVPLCGKSLDMWWLRHRGYRVLGVDISPIAVRAFFEERDLDYSERSGGAFTRLNHDAIELLCGDFFSMEPAHLSDVRAVYDRASLIAFPSSGREKYVRHLLRILPAAIPFLLVTLEYPQSEMDGPPYAVDEAEVRSLFGNTYAIHVLEAREVLQEQARFRERGLSRLTEKAYLLSADEGNRPPA